MVLIFTFTTISISQARSASEIVSLQNQIQSLSRSLDGVTGDYGESLDKLEHLNDDISSTEKKLQYSEAQAKKYQEFYADRLDGLYRHGQVSILDVLLNAENFDDFLQRFEYISRIGKTDKKNSDKYIKAAKEYKTAKDKLAIQKAEQQQLTNSLARQRKDLESKLGTQKSLLAKLEAERKRSQTASRQSSSRSRNVSYTGSYSVQSINGFVFPTVANHSYTNDWGNPRSGGRRHQGTDIFAEYGSPAFAVKSGTIKNHNSGRGGMMIYLKGDDGNTYIYAHMSAYSRGNGEHVNAGDVVGEVGDSGNARGGSPHIHFEVHPGGGGAVNPYPILRAGDPNYNQ